MSEPTGQDANEVIEWTSNTRTIGRWQRDELGLHLLVEFDVTCPHCQEAYACQLKIRDMPLKLAAPLPVEQARADERNGDHGRDRKKDQKQHGHADGE
ncbi:MAG: hypothetical protein JO296_21315 [Pseudonocardiales bacterium]|nr:hypothetical protein [Pseudonocardiales bacterium]